MAVVEEFHGFDGIRSSDCGSRRGDTSVAFLAAPFDSRAAIPDDATVVGTRVSRRSFTMRMAHACMQRRLNE
jgi:hypothetical protein